MNFKPKIKMSSKFIKKIDNKLIKCKNFIFIILLVEYLNVYNRLYDKNTISYNIFIFKKKKTIGSILRAPYKNKATQFKLKLSRYFIIFNIKLILNKNINIDSNTKIIHLVNKLLKSFYYFESTLITQTHKIIYLPFSLKIKII
jgi:hypothetical protein